jgi:hypothetical protein
MTYLCDESEYEVDHRFRYGVMDGSFQCLVS